MRLEYGSYWLFENIVPVPTKPSVEAKDVASAINLFNKLPLGEGKHSAGVAAKAALSAYLKAQMDKAKAESESDARVDEIMTLLGMFL